MKTQMNVYLSQSTATLLRERAAEVSAPVGDLTDLFIRFALERMPADALRKWANTRANTRGRLGGALTKNERAVLGAFERLKKKPGNDLAWRFSHSDIAIEAGLRVAVGYDALKALQARENYVVCAELEEVDRWGRPVKSYWSLISQMPEHLRPKRV